MRWPQESVIENIATDRKGGAEKLAKLFGVIGCATTDNII